MIHATDLRREFGSGNGKIAALNDVTFQVQRREKVALVGQSGSGKTTLLNILAGMDRLDSGDLIVNEQNLSRLKRNQLAQYRLKTIGVIFQAFQLIHTRSALQNVELPMMLAGDDRRSRREQAAAALERVGLASRQDHLPGQLSGGEQQRVAIARAIANRPLLLLADEPTGNLDSNTTRHVMDLLIEVVHENQMTLMMITHDLALANRYTERIYKMVDGVLDCDDSKTTNDKTVAL